MEATLAGGDMAAVARAVGVGEKQGADLATILLPNMEVKDAVDWGLQQKPPLATLMYAFRENTPKGLAKMVMFT